MTTDPTRYAALLESLDTDARADLEVTVEEILDAVGRDDPERIEQAADLFEDRAPVQPDQDMAVVAMMIVASLRDHAIRVRQGMSVRPQRMTANIGHSTYFLFPPISAR